MKKVIMALITATCMIFMCSTAFASGSTSSTVTISNSGSSSFSNGKFGKVVALQNTSGLHSAIVVANTEISAITESEPMVRLSVMEVTTLMRTIGGAGATDVVSALLEENITVPEGTVFPYSIDFNIDGVTSGMNVKVFEWIDSAWKVIPTFITDGHVIATFDAIPADTEIEILFSEAK